MLVDRHGNVDNIILNDFDPDLDKDGLQGHINDHENEGSFWVLFVMHNGEYHPAASWNGHLVAVFPTWEYEPKE
jgi:hypothetical protein